MTRDKRSKSAPRACWLAFRCAACVGDVRDSLLVPQPFCTSGCAGPSAEVEVEAKADPEAMRGRITVIAFQVARRMQK